MTEQNQQGLEFCEITFAVPAQQFGIACSLSTEEPLPVVTEFVLRVVHACDSITPKQLEEYFGFTPSEMAAVIRTLVDERLLNWEEDSLELTPYARARFIDSSDSIPRFFKIKDYSVDLVFDLMSFVPSEQTKVRVNRVDTLMELVPKNLERASRTKTEAERSFQEHFHRVYKDTRAEIYKISEVEPGERFYIPLTCRFAIDVRNGIQVSRGLSDQSFDNRLEIASAISKTLSASEMCENPNLEEFQERFKDTFIKPYLKVSELLFSEYVQQVHLLPDTKHAEEETVPILGSLHLASNRALILTRLKNTESITADRAYWLAPQSRYWSRARSVKSLVRGISALLKRDTQTVDPTTDQLQKALVKVIFQMRGSDDKELAKIYENTFPSSFFTTGLVMGGRVEMLLYPGRLMCALYHYRIEESPMSVPIGIMSSSSSHLLAAAQVLKELVQGQNVHKLGSRGARVSVLHQDLEFIQPELHATVNGVKL